MRVEDGQRRGRRSRGSSPRSEGRGSSRSGAGTRRTARTPRRSEKRSPMATSWPPCSPRRKAGIKAVHAPEPREESMCALPSLPWSLFARPARLGALHRHRDDEAQAPGRPRGLAGRHARGLPADRRRPRRGRATATSGWSPSRAASHGASPAIRSRTRRRASAPTASGWPSSRPARAARRSSCWSSAGGEARKATSLADRRRSFPWLDDQNLLVASASSRLRRDECNKKKLESAASPLGARLRRAAVRHWDAWDDGRRSHLFVVPLDGGRERDLTPGNRDVPPLASAGRTTGGVSRRQGGLLLAQRRRRAGRSPRTPTSSWCPWRAGSRGRSPRPPATTAAAATARTARRIAYRAQMRARLRGRPLARDGLRPQDRRHHEPDRGLRPPRGVELTWSARLEDDLLPRRGRRPRPRSSRCPPRAAP